MVNRLSMQLSPKRWPDCELPKPNLISSRHTEGENSTDLLKSFLINMTCNQILMGGREIRLSYPEIFVAMGT